MYICLNCKEQFSSAVTRYGDCPYCGTVNVIAQDRINLESDAMFKNSNAIKRIMSFIDRKKLGR